MASGEADAPRRILLVGFMASGKSTVGPSLAARLGWSFLDVDTAVSDEVGLRIPEVFELRGEAFFREREHAATCRALTRDRCVLAAGGGWPAVAGRLEGLDPSTASVWLEVPVEELLRRIGKSPGGRPLLAGSDPEKRVRELLRLREPFYRMARLTVDGRGLPEQVAERIAHGLFGARGRTETRIPDKERMP
jgi:shikimate kinase